MDILWYGLKVAVVGMLVVFVGLIILIGCIKAFKAAGREQEQQTGVTPIPDAPHGISVPAASPRAQDAPGYYVPGPLLTRTDDAFYAVITAAVAQTLEAEGVNPEGGFRITAIKQLNEPKIGPKLTPKDDAFYAVLTGAIARTLETEGINPEGGFAIRSVKAL